MADSIRVLLQEFIISDGGNVLLEGLPSCFQALRVQLVEGRKCRQCERDRKVIHLYTHNASAHHTST